MPAQTAERRIIWKNYVPVSIAAQVEHRLMDPITRKPRYGLRSKLISKLLRDWLAENPVPARNLTSDEVEALDEELKLVLKSIIYKVLKSFDPDDDGTQMLMISKNKNVEGSTAITTMNMDEYEATAFMYEVTEFLSMRIQDDAPPREMMS